MASVSAIPRWIPSGGSTSESKSDSVAVEGPSLVIGGSGTAFASRIDALGRLGGSGAAALAGSAVRLGTLGGIGDASLPGVVRGSAVWLGFFGGPSAAARAAVIRGTLGGSGGGAAGN